MLAPLAKLWIASRLTKARRREYILSNDLLSYKGRRLHADRVNPQNRTAVWKKKEVMRDITSRRVLCEIKVREEKSGRIGIWIVSLVRYSSLRIQSAEHSLFLPPYLFPFFFLFPFAFPVGSKWEHPARSIFDSAPGNSRRATNPTER